MDEKSKILDIAMNLNRIGNWAADDFQGKQKRIKTFLKNTNGYIESVNEKKLPKPFKNTYKYFLKSYSVLERKGQKTPKDTMYWAEQMMTWGNILTHRSKLI